VNASGFNAGIACSFIQDRNRGDQDEPLVRGWIEAVGLKRLRKAK